MTCTCDVAQSYHSPGCPAWDSAHADGHRGFNTCPDRCDCVWQDDFEHTDTPTADAYDKPHPFGGAMGRNVNERRTSAMWDHGKTEYLRGAAAERARWHAEIDRHIATYSSEEDRLRQEYGERAALPYVARTLALIDLYESFGIEGEFEHGA